MLKKPVFHAGKASLVSELPPVIKQNNKTIRNSTKMTSIQFLQKSIKKLACSNLEDKREKNKPKFRLGQLVRAADSKKVFIKGGSTNYSY